MGKVISLKNEAFKRMDKFAHATTVYVHNMANKDPLTEETPKAKLEEKPLNATFIPFGTPVPKEWTLAGAMERIKPKERK